MPNIYAINSALYTLLNGDEMLTGLCTIYKGAKRPRGEVNPSLTVFVDKIEPGKGKGLWLCDVTVRAYDDVGANRMPDHETLGIILARVNDVMINAQLTIEGAKALPIIGKESKGPEWEYLHDHEANQEIIYQLILVQFD